MKNLDKYSKSPVLVESDSPWLGKILSINIEKKSCVLEFIDAMDDSGECKHKKGDHITVLMKNITTWEN